MMCNALSLVELSRPAVTSVLEHAMIVNQGVHMKCANTLVVGYFAKLHAASRAHPVTKNAVDAALMQYAPNAVHSRVIRANIYVHGDFPITSVITFVERNVTALDAMPSCPKKLACGHPCIGLCGENCPRLCSVCHNKKLSSMLGEGRGKTMKTTRYLQLHDCGHILTVEQMDAWMMHQLSSEAQLIRYPLCSKAITFRFRYGNLVKRTLIYYDNVRKEISDIANEAAKFSSRLMRHQSYFSSSKFPGKRTTGSLILYRKFRLNRSRP